MHTDRRKFLAMAGSVAAGFLAGAAGSGSAFAAGTVDTSVTGTITVAQSGFEFDSEDLAKQWWKSIAEQFAARYPNATLNVETVGGTDLDLVAKLALQYRAGAAPDLVSIPIANVAQFASSGYLAPLDNELKSSSFWAEFLPNVQAMTAINGTTYAVSSGSNTTGIFYNKAMFKEAGLPTDWKPNSWADIIAAAKVIKEKRPDVIPLWLVGGEPGGTFGTAYGIADLLYGTSTPTMYNAETKKWIVDSPGLRAALGFYKDVYSQGLGAAPGDLLSPNATNMPPDLMSKGKLAMAFGVNFYPGSWFFDFATPWKNAPTEAGVAPVPSQNGEGPVSTLLGWAYAVSEKSENKKLAWALIELMMEADNSVLHANNGGFVPPSTKVAAHPDFTTFAPPQGDMASYIQFSKALPAEEQYPGYARALNQATGYLISNPNGSIDEAIQLLTQTLQQQFGPDSTEVVK